jgi:hypothetical protein
MKYFALLLFVLAPCVAAAAEPDTTRDVQVHEKFVPGGYIRLHLSPGGYTITKGDADSIRVTYQRFSPGQAAKVKVQIRASASSADVSVSDTPLNNFQATIEVPQRSDLRVRLFAGEVLITCVEGDKDVEVNAGRIEVKVPDPAQYGHRDASVRAGSIEASAFDVSKGGFVRSFEQQGTGKYRLHTHVTTGEIDLNRAP